MNFKHPWVMWKYVNEMEKWFHIKFQLLQMANIPSNFLIPDWVSFSQLDFPFPLSCLKFVWLLLTHSSLPVESFQFDTIRLQIQIFICLAHFSIKMCQNLHLTFHWHIISHPIEMSQGCWPKNANYMSCLPRTLNSWWNLIKQIAQIDSAWLYHFKHFRKAKKSQKGRQKA